MSEERLKSEAAIGRAAIEELAAIEALQTNQFSKVNHDTRMRELLKVEMLRRLIDEHRAQWPAEPR